MWVRNGTATAAGWAVPAAEDGRGDAGQGRRGGGLRAALAGQRVVIVGDSMARQAFVTLVARLRGHDAVVEVLLAAGAQADEAAAVSDEATAADPDRPAIRSGDCKTGSSPAVPGAHVISRRDCVQGRFRSLTSSNGL